MLITNNEKLMKMNTVLLFSTLHMRSMLPPLNTDITFTDCDLKSANI